MHYWTLIQVMVCEKSGQQTQLGLFEFVMTIGKLKEKSYCLVALQMRRDREERVERSREKRKRDWRVHGNGENRPRGDNRARQQRQPVKVAEPIERSQTCPFLVRIFYAINDFNQYSNDKPLPKDREVRLYLWKDVSLKEIVELLRAHLPTIRTKQRFVLSRVHKAHGNLVRKEMGTVLVHKKSELADEKTLENHNFSIGDYIDASINYK